MKIIPIYSSVFENVTKDVAKAVLLPQCIEKVIGVVSSQLTIKPPKG